MPVLGVVENMSGFVCPHCGKTSDIFRQGGGQRMAEEMGVPFLATIPIDPGLVLAGDQGEVFTKDQPTTPAAQAFEALAEAVAKAAEAPKEAGNVAPAQASKKGNGTTMRVAIPVANGQLCMHFGHCEEFALVDVDQETKTIQGQTRMTPPAHEPGVLPAWIKEQGADLVIAGGMGQRAQQIFAQHGVQVLVGAPAEAPEVVVQAYLDGNLQTGDNVCDH
jgi:predicted Fe-Mo cluster-binding NifX family protein